MFLYSFVPSVFPFNGGFVGSLFSLSTPAKYQAQVHLLHLSFLMSKLQLPSGLWFWGILMGLSRMKDRIMWIGASSWGVLDSSENSSSLLHILYYSYVFY
ncbi:hypothetical protein SAY86_020139 [Trapa natans]|uniref:Uncharacterized protein n=1 Tax=Trapa natans TaxID=22666 RepID=A0AAN7LMY9_TRANT|nr:hypothetical protein SAY86_020139 [Trapa natans]